VAAAEPAVSAAGLEAVVWVADTAVLAAEPEAAVWVADVAEPQASVDIVVAFDTSAPVSVAVVEVDSSGCPKFLSFPNIDYYASSSSSVEVVGKEWVHSSTCSHASYGLSGIFSNPGLHHNKSLGHCYNMPSPGRNKVSDTTCHSMASTTSHSRRKCLHLYQEQRTHCPYQA